MGKIHLIDGYSKIAAGEVIERPASVVKELLENAIDADATQIFITIEKAGKNLIQVQDNGKGIDEDDVDIAFQRHTSSKIQSADDLDKLNTLGFRGEALASIVAISQMEIITRPRNQEYAVRLKSSAGEIEEKEQVGAPIGTTIKIFNLFFNLPVRQKFMRSNRIELGYITDILTRYSLAYPLVHFKLIHNKLTIINSPVWASQKRTLDSQKFNDHRENLPIEAYGYSIQTIYGKKVLKNLIPIQYNDGNKNLFGYIGNPSIARSEKSAASLFVNKRLVTNKKFSQVMINAFKDFLMRNRFPFYIIFLEVSPSIVDFNIHPTKKMVKFIDETNFFAELQIIIKNLIQSEFKKHQIIINQNVDKFSDSKEKIVDYWRPNKPKIQMPSFKNPESTHLEKSSDTSPLDSGILTRPKSSQKKLFIGKSKQKVTQTHFKTEKQPTKTFSKQIYDSPKKTSSLSGLSETIISPNIQVSQLPPLNLLNNGIQAGKTYLIFQNEENLIIIDQHAAHERINYEKAQKMFDMKAFSIQNLIVPIKMDVAPNETEFVKESISKIKKYGFEIEYFGGNTFIIRSIPAFIKWKNQETLIKDMCLEILHLGKEQSFSDLKREIIQYTGCHMSIRSGDEIWNQERIRRLIKDLDCCENPHFCAHGRPVYIKVSYKELDKWFHRTN